MNLNWRFQTTDILFCLLDKALTEHCSTVFQQHYRYGYFERDGKLGKASECVLAADLDMDYLLMLFQGAGACDFLLVPMWVYNYTYKGWQAPLPFLDPRSVNKSPLTYFWFPP